MTKDQKSTAIAELKDTFANSQYFYLTDSSGMTVEDVNKLRRLCFEKGITMKVVKNSIAQKAMEALPEESGYAPLYDSLKGPTTIMFAESGSLVAKTISEFRKTNAKPTLKAAYIDKDVFTGDDQLDVLKTLKSKDDLIGDVIILLQSPIQKVLGSLNSGSTTIGGLLKTLEERAGN
jgi:large subunit ribosomal protein L10